MIAPRTDNPADSHRTREDLPPADLALALLEALPSHVAVLDETATIVAVSGAWRRFWQNNGGGPSSCGVGSNYLAVCDAASNTSADASAVAEGLRRVIAGEQAEFFHAYECHAPVQQRWYQMRINRLDWPGPVRILIVHQAITEVHLLEEARRQRLVEAAHVSRLCLIGRMASELVHELTQPLSAVGNYARGCQRRLESATAPDGVKEALTLIVGEAGRAEEIVRKARGFSARRDPVRVPVDLSALVNNSRVLWTEHVRRKGAEVRVRADAPVTILGDAGQIEQIVLNAVVNAIDAGAGAPGGGGGGGMPTVEVSVTRRGAVAEVEVSDNGPGLSPAVRARIFQPFVTSKSSGLGMGLVICRSIAQDHGGDVSLTDRVGGPGAVFKLTLPAASPELSRGPS
ncbi:MAG: HAMP domain-containing histidine kinase [Planctomycetes bacterium]|nr:HAMP domain-containing histidine kinase [Planctomycetota bacterium]